MRAGVGARVLAVTALTLLLLIVPININATPTSADQTLAQELIDQYFAARSVLINLYNFVLSAAANKTLPNLQAQLKVVNASIATADKLIAEAQSSYQSGDYLKAKTLALMAINKLTPAYHILNAILKELNLINSTVLGVYYKTLEMVGFCEREKLFLNKVNQSVMAAKMHGINVTNITENLTKLCKRLNNMSMILNRTLSMIKNMTCNMTCKGTLHNMTRKLVMVMNRTMNMTLNVSMNTFSNMVRVMNKMMLKITDQLKLKLKLLMSQVGKHMGSVVLNMTGDNFTGVGLGLHYHEKGHGAPTNTTNTTSHVGGQEKHEKSGHGNHKGGKNGG